MERLTVSNAMNALQKSKRPYQVLGEQGSLQVGFYKPDQVDLQQPHERDEVYVIAAGSGEFVQGDKKQKVEVGEVLLVPAGVEHRFENFTEDFAVWVFFYGPAKGN